ncbi:uncharacterized protein LOC110453467 [Mizuhopecten yessoensis]|uniref:uncharacterized protein LOC110453467 n=1 Tax=Mizuhopecten yessoensis TaxID=6573 RepID=UPI000B45F771|nr:uncharacterized protein LOC110453467 [Mizuhopecten yessoensis]
MKKDLILSRLSQFNDRSERYFVWKSSFMNISKELEVNPPEELDLLCRWLGPASSIQANSLRAANYSNEAEAVRKIWDRLNERYGAPELVVQAFHQRLENLPKLANKDCVKIYELSDLLTELESLKLDELYSSSLAYLDSSAGVNPIVNKLPGFMQGKWTDRALRYKREHGVLYPPFTLFAEFVRSMASRMNDPSFKFEPVSATPVKAFANNKKVSSSSAHASNTKFTLSTRKTDVVNQNSTDLENTCPIHGEKAAHNLKDCKTFQAKSIPEKKDVILKYGICFKCCVGKHLAKDCTQNIKCGNCGSASHCTAFHCEPDSSHGGESDRKCESPRTNSKVLNKCTQICGTSNSFKGKSCAKTILIQVFPNGRPEEALKAYAIIDDQSNRSLARSEFFQHFNENSGETEYILSSCAGTVTTSGRRATGYTIQSLDQTCSLRCPTLIECDEIPNERQEIPTPAVARHHKHLNDIEQFIPEYDPEAQILLLIGRDMIAAHHILDQRIGSDDEPYAQKLRLGWVIIGETCLGKVHTSDVVSVNKTHVLQDHGRESVLKPCPDNFELRDEHMNSDVFQTTLHDEEIGLSQEDREFSRIMKKGFTRSVNGNWSAPLPFRKGRKRLPNNYQQARQRAENLVKSLKRDPVKQEHFVQFMKKIFDNKHAEEALHVREEEEHWYLPIFGVYNPQKPSKVRVVFDSSAKYQGLSLNDVLLTGPDLTNNLVGVLLKFRKERIAVTADVEQMFFNFEVHEEHRNMLRFLWFRDNDPAREITEYRMRVHVFGNSPSPAVATHGLRKAVCDHEENRSRCDEVCNYVRENFYVDDALVSRQHEEDIVNLVKQTQERLKQGGNIRLHKIISNNANVVASFPLSDLAENMSELDFTTGTSSVHRSLGLSWDVTRDIFTYKVSEDDKPYTKRGLLSTVHSIFDPLGFVAPVVLGGRLLMREAIHNNDIGWDEVLPYNVEGSHWDEWKRSLKDLETLKIPRICTEISLEEGVRRELHMFSDASKEAIGTVGYLKVYDASGDSSLGFVLGKSKVAPRHGHTIPRLELCAAVLATELSDFITKHLAVSLDATYFYTDSQVVLGYVNNKTRRFHVYVSNRVNRILRSSSSAQWNYVPTTANPADQATRPVKASDLRNSKWFKGPVAFLDKDAEKKTFDLVDPDQDKEIQPKVDVLKTSALVTTERLGDNRFQRFSSWTRLTSAISRLKQTAASHHKCDNLDTRNNVDLRKEAELLVLKEVQREMYSSELHCLQGNKLLPKTSSLLTFSPVLDKNGLLRVGGRLKNTKLETGEKTPIIIPGSHHVAKLLVRHYHEELHHQGRHLTEGAIRSAGYWITGGKRLINSVLHACVNCKKLRGKVEHQKMSDLPSDRLTPSPPFTYVGVDTFGPWSVTTRRTRGGIANSKRWAIMFSCLVTRGIHIEVVEELSSSSFINSLRRFISLRGPVREFRSDCGTNFVGATGELGMNTINIEDQDIGSFLVHHKVVWKFNPPHASHMGGAWERMIGLVRRILDSMLCEVQGKQLTHEVLCTLMAEVCAIINSRPITSVSSDPDSPTILSPSALITQKVNEDEEPFEELGIKDMYKSQWRHVQVLADQFWNRWSSQYLQNLQLRMKWQQERRNLEVGEVVLMMDSSVPRNQWPVGLVERVFPSSDGLVRKASVRVMRGTVPVTYIRPITQLVYLCSE